MTVGVAQKRLGSLSDHSVPTAAPSGRSARKIPKPATLPSLLHKISWLINSSRWTRTNVKFVYQVALAIGAKTIMEVGASFGVLTIYLALAVGEHASKSGKVFGTEEAKKAGRGNAGKRPRSIPDFIKCFAVRCHQSEKGTHTQSQGQLLIGRYLHVREMVGEPCATVR